MNYLYLCRHGETAWSLSGQHTGKADIPLTEKGKEQARLLRERLEEISFEKIYTSPRRRAMETCEGMGAIIEPLAVEWDYGEYEGLTSKEILEKKEGWDLFSQRCPRGEGPLEVGQRADQFLAKIRACSGNIALFSHGHFLRVLAARFLGLRPEEGRLLALSVASLSLLNYSGRGQPQIMLWNDTHHLLSL